MSRVAGAIVGVLAFSVVVTAAEPTYQQIHGPVHHGTLTTKNGATNDFTGSADRVTVSAPEGPVDANLREVFWRPSPDNWGTNQVSCITWDTTGTVGERPPIQPGLATRIAPSDDGHGLRAVTITQNVWAKAVWLFWVDVWDTSKSTSELAYDGIERFDVSPVVGKAWIGADDKIHSTLVPAPWHVCARTMGRNFAFKVWTGDNPEPSWDDAQHVFSTTLPGDAVHPGYSGGYIGHLHSGESATFSGQSVERTCASRGSRILPGCPSSEDPASSHSPPAQK